MATVADGQKDLIEDLATGQLDLSFASAMSTLSLSPHQNKSDSVHQNPCSFFGFQNVKF